MSLSELFLAATIYGLHIYSPGILYIWRKIHPTNKFLPDFKAWLTSESRTDIVCVFCGQKWYNAPVSEDTCILDISDFKLSLSFVFLVFPPVTRLDNQASCPCL